MSLRTALWLQFCIAGAITCLLPLGVEPAPFYSLVVIGEVRPPGLLQVVQLRVQHVEAEEAHLGHGHGVAGVAGHGRAGQGQLVTRKRARRGGHTRQGGRS